MDGPMKALVILHPVRCPFCRHMFFEASKGWLSNSAAVRVKCARCGEFTAMGDLIETAESVAQQA